MFLQRRGEWNPESVCEKNSAICGVRVRIDAYRGAGVGGSYDDTSLNGAEFRCCPLPDLFNSTVKDCHTDHITGPSKIPTTQYVPTVSHINETYGMRNWNE